RTRGSQHQGPYPRRPEGGGLMESVERLPPYNPDAERSVLGSCLRDNGVIDDVTLLLAADDFYMDAHQKVFPAIVALLCAGQAVAEVCDFIDSCQSHSGNAGGTPTGFADIDTMTGGLHASSLVLIAARPSVGKTAMGAAVALRLAFAGQPVFFASLEQSRLEL